MKNVLSFKVLESVVKNCGSTIHDEVANKQTMEELKEILKVILVVFCKFGIKVTVPCCLLLFWN